VSLSDFLAVILIGAGVYRVARFLILDDLIEEPRDKFHDLLARHPNWFSLKLQTLMLCPFCLTIWVSFIAIMAWEYDWFPDWMWMWMGAATVALVFWTYIDSED
jgi:hypothetical protein